MLIEAAVGFGLGLVSALVFWALVLTGLEKLNQGLASSTLLVALVAACLWLDGWIATAILGYVLCSAGLTALRSSLR